MPVGHSAASSNGAPLRHGPRWAGLRLVFLVPVIAFISVISLIIALAIGLNRDPNKLPSALIGKQVPTFNLVPVKGRTLGLSSADLKGDVTLVNVFASWCVACREEHPLLMRISQQGLVAVHGLNYKDGPDDVAHWLETMGDPYTRTGADLDGRVAIDWGVYGVPETYVIDRQGRIAFKQVGPITPEILERTILPMIVRLRGDQSPPVGGLTR